MAHRILAMDGGNGMNSATMLVQLGKLLESPEMKGYLDVVDLFAGTSDGALNALFLAEQQSPTAALANIQGYWDSVNKAMFVDAITPGSVVLGLSGVTALSSSTQLRDFFIGYFGNSTTLGNLKHKVLIVSFELDNEDPLHQRWTPRFFKNFGPPETNDSDLLVVDVAMRTTAFPILRPIYQALAETGPGYVDGGLVANQPSMCALAEAYHILDATLERRTTPEDVLLLSLGTGFNPVGGPTYLSPKMSGGFANWGYFQWLTNPASPLTLINLMLQSNGSTVDYQCRAMLRERYHRINPDVEHDLIPDNEATRLQIKAGADWARHMGWMEPTIAGSVDPGPSGGVEHEGNPKSSPAPQESPAKASGHETGSVKESGSKPSPEETSTNAPSSTKERVRESTPSSAHQPKPSKHK